MPEYLVAKFSPLWALPWRIPRTRVQRRRSRCRTSAQFGGRPFVFPQPPPSPRLRSRRRRRPQRFLVMKRLLPRRRLLPLPRRPRYGLKLTFLSPLVAFAFKRGAMGDTGLKTGWVRGAGTRGAGRGVGQLRTSLIEFWFLAPESVCLGCPECTFANGPVVRF